MGNLSLLRESKQFTYNKQKLPFSIINTISKHVPFWGIPMIIDNQWQSSGNPMYEDMGSSHLMPWLSKRMCKSRGVRKAFHYHTHFQIIFHVAKSVQHLCTDLEDSAPSMQKCFQKYSAILYIPCALSWKV